MHSSALSTELFLGCSFLHTKTCIALYERMKGSKIPKNLIVSTDLGIPEL